MLGVDAGGSYTRAVCVGLDGRVLGVARAGGGSPTHNADASEQVQRAISDALDGSDRRASDVVALAAGLAGFGSERDRRWADSFFDLDGLDCPREIVNDTVVAHAGAFAGGPGVIVVAGTGSMILAITESGEVVRNDRYHHYAGGARHLSFDAMARILMGQRGATDDDFIASVLDYWHAADPDELRQRIRDLETQDSNDVKRFYGAMAPLVTSAAEQSDMASAACHWLAGVTSVGVRLLGEHFDQTPVLVARAGAVATCPAISRPLAAYLEKSDSPRYKLVDARLRPVGGAALLALRRAGVDTDEAVVKSIHAGTSQRHTA